MNDTFPEDETDLTLSEIQDMIQKATPVEVAKKYPFRSDYKCDESLVVKDE